MLGKKQAGAQQARKMRLTNQLAEPNPPRTVTLSYDAISQKRRRVHPRLPRSK